jgi:hypothetical protein
MYITSTHHNLFGKVGKTGEGNWIRRDVLTSGRAVLLGDKHAESLATMSTAQLQSL